MKKKTNTRYIPTRNYLIAALMFIAVILITLYVFKWYQVKVNEKISKSYLVENNLVINQVTSIDELDQVLNESPNRLLLYISYRNDRDIYNIEKKYNKLFKKYNIQDLFYLYDITDYKKNNNAFNALLNKKLDIEVTGYPVAIYYESGQIVSYKKISNVSDLENLIKKYNID